MKMKKVYLSFSKNNQDHTHWMQLKLKKIIIIAIKEKKNSGQMKINKINKI